MLDRPVSLKGPGEPGDVSNVGATASITGPNDRATGKLLRELPIRPERLPD